MGRDGNGVGIAGVDRYKRFRQATREWLLSKPESAYLTAEDFVPCSRNQ